MYLIIRIFVFIDLIVVTTIRKFLSRDNLCISCISRIFFVILMPVMDAKYSKNLNDFFVKTLMKNIN